MQSSTWPLRELALLGLLALLWGSSYLFIKIAVAEIPPVTLIAGRVTIAAVILGAVVWAHGHRLPSRPATWGRLLLQAVVNSIAAWTLLAWGQQHVDAGLASVLNSTSPIFVFFITLLVTRHEASGALRLLGACVGALGVVLIVGPDVLGGLAQQVTAQGAILASALLYGFAAIHGRRFSGLPAPVTAAATMFCAALCLVPASLVLDRPWGLTVSPGALAALGLLGVFCTGLAMLLYFRLIKTLGSIGVASQSYLRAGVGVVLGVILLGESVSLTVAAGLACAITGVAMINLRTNRRA